VTCDECGREHLHDPGTFLVINVFRSEMFPKMLVAYAVDPENPDEIHEGIVHGFTNTEIEDKVHAKFPRQSLHWHWLGKTRLEQERISQRIYRGELDATDADGVETMGGQQ
jgi:hypothetical protein